MVLLSRKFNDKEKGRTATRSVNGGILTHGLSITDRFNDIKVMTLQAALSFVAHCILFSCL